MPSYEEEQESLREGGEEEALPEVFDPEVNPVLYRDVESMLFRGFVISRGQIGEATVIWKSLNHYEYDYLTLAWGEDTNNKDFQVAFFVASTFMMDGNNMLGNTESLRSLFADLAFDTRKLILRNLHEVNRRANFATRLVEAFAMERTSRVRWSQLKGETLNSVNVTGIQGTDLLGHNWAQLIWRSLNMYEDTVEQADQQWENAKFIGSCFTKLAKVYSQDNRRKRQNKIDRADRKRSILEQVVMLTPEAEIPKSGGARIDVARNESELMRQVAKELRGEKDLHDQVVESTMKRIQDMRDYQRLEREKFHKEQEELHDGQAMTGGYNMVGMTIDQVRDDHNRKVLEARKHLRNDVPILDEESDIRARKWGMVPDLPAPSPEPMPPSRIRNVPVTPVRRRELVHAWKEREFQRPSEVHAGR